MKKNCEWVFFSEHSVGTHKFMTTHCDSSRWTNMAIKI